jgi:BON domain
MVTWKEGPEASVTKHNTPWHDPRGRRKFFAKEHIMRNIKSLTIISALAALVGLTGCEIFQHHDSERTAGRVLDDKTITAKVVTALKTEPVFKFDQVDVKTFDGVVQLSGFVNTEEQKTRAAELAQQTPGVSQVVNSISLKPQPGPTPTGRATGYSRPQTSPGPQKESPSPQQP